MEAAHHGRRQYEGVARHITTRAAVQANLARTAAVIDRLAAQLQTRASQVSHVTIEARGLAPALAAEEAWLCASVVFRCLWGLAFQASVRRLRHKRRPSPSAIARAWCCQNSRDLPCLQDSRHLGVRSVA